MSGMGGGIAGAIGQVASSLINTIGSSVTANRQNRKNRNFQAQQAQINRDWQEDMYNKYYSPSAQLADQMKGFQENGLNPALMYGRGTSISAGSPPSGGSPSGGSSLMGDWSLDLRSAMEIAEMVKNNKVQRDKSRAETNLLKQQTINAQTENEIGKSVLRLNNQQMGKINAEIDLLKKQSNTEDSRKLLNVTQAALNQANNKQVDYKNALSNEFEKVFGFKADSQTINAIMLGTSGLIGSFGSSIFNIIGKTIGK